MAIGVTRGARVSGGGENGKETEEHEHRRVWRGIYKFPGVCWQSTLAATVGRGLCRRRAVEHARVEEDGDEDLFVHFAWIRGEEVSWPGCSWAAAWAAFVGRLLGCRGGLWQPGEPGKSLSFFFISVFFFCFVFLFLNSIQI
jgi:hypothetical protein